MSQYTPKAFFDELRRRIKASGKSVKRIAREINVGYGTVRSWFSRKEISRKGCIGMCAAISWPITPEDVERLYDVKICQDRELARGGTIIIGAQTAGDLLRQIAIEDQHISRLRVSDRVLDYASAMREGDFFAYTSYDRAPYESVRDHRPKLFDARVKGIAAGARFLYIVPEANTELVDDLNKYARAVLHELVDAYKWDAPKARARVTTRLLVCPMQRCELWIPGFSFGLHQASDSEGKCVQRSSIRLPIDFSSEIIHSDDDLSHAKRMIQFVTDTLSAHERKAKNTPRKKVPYAEIRELVEKNAGRRRIARTTPAAES